MKKILALTLIILTMCLLFTACKCEHQFEETVTKEASCTAVGIKTFTCKECNESYTEEIPMLEHTYTSAVTKEPTCAEKGTTTFTCTGCDHSYTEEIEMVAHTWGEATVTKEPTCIAEGEKTATCTVCGATEISEKIATVEHTYQSKVKVAATCTEKGTNTLTCAVCNNSKEESSKALGHNYQQSNVVTQCTCTTDGEVTMTCTRCKDSYNETQRATGHNWVDANCTKAKHCTNCDLKEGDALGHEFSGGSCTRCGIKEISIKIDEVALKKTLSYCYAATNHVYSQGKIIDCSYEIKSNGECEINFTFEKTYAESDNERYPAGAFVFKVLDSNGKVVKKAHIFQRNVRVGQSFTNTFIYELEPGAYVITFGDYKITGNGSPVD